LRDHCTYDEEVHDYLFIGEYEKLNNLDGIEERKIRYKRRDEERAERRRREEEVMRSRRDSVADVPSTDDTSNGSRSSSWLSSLMGRYSGDTLDSEATIHQLYDEVINRINSGNQPGQSPYWYTATENSTPEPEPEQ